MPGQACVFKAFRASFTLLAARYIAAADAKGRGHLPLGLGEVAAQAVAAADDLGLPLRQAGVHQLPDAHLLSVSISGGSAPLQLGSKAEAIQADLGVLFSAARAGDE